MDRRTQWSNKETAKYGIKNITLSGEDIMRKTYKDATVSKQKIIKFSDYLKNKFDKELGELPVIEIDDENMYDMYALLELDQFFAQQHTRNDLRRTML